MAARPKRDLKGRVVIDGEPFDWRVNSEPLWSPASGWRGLSLMVIHAEGQRAAILQFPMPPRPPNGLEHLQRPKVSLTTVEKAIKDVLDSGWEPMGRGKTVTYDLDWALS